MKVALSNYDQTKISFWPELKPMNVHRCCPIDLKGLLRSWMKVTPVVRRSFEPHFCSFKIASPNATPLR